jgi:hypothetical protein
MLGSVLVGADRKTKVTCLIAIGGLYALKPMAPTSLLYS